MKAILIILSLYFLPFCLSNSEMIAHMNAFNSLRVIDGDSLELNFNNGRKKIRLLYIDAPELGQKKKGVDLGEKAKKELERIIGACSDIYFKVRGKGFYGRYLSEAVCDEENISLRMIQLGMAKIYPFSRFQSLRQKITFNKAYKKARQNKVGLLKFKWNPYLYRKKLKNNR